MRRTNINLDMDLVDEAARDLGTRRTTDTVHQALREVVEDLTPEALDAMRRPAGRTA